MKVIFLDFDGVLDNEYYDMMLIKSGLPESDKYGPIFDPECVDNLRVIIEKTGADIVVSSTWKYLMSYPEFIEMWKERELPGFVTDSTPNVSKHRGDEIDAWLKECREDCEYVIIDDLGTDNFNEHQLSRYVGINPYHGLDETSAEKAISILSNK